MNKNRDKSDPEAYCGSIKHKVEDKENEDATITYSTHGIMNDVRGEIVKFLSDGKWHPEFEVSHYVADALGINVWDRVISRVENLLLKEGVTVREHDSRIPPGDLPVVKSSWYVRLAGGGIHESMEEGLTRWGQTVYDNYKGLHDAGDRNFMEREWPFFLEEYNIDQSLPFEEQLLQYVKIQEGFHRKVAHKRYEGEVREISRNDLPSDEDIPAHDPGHYIGVKVGGELVAALCYSGEAYGPMMVNMVWVREDFRGRGLADEMIEWITDVLSPSSVDIWNPVHPATVHLRRKLQGMEFELDIVEAETSRIAGEQNQFGRWRHPNLARGEEIVNNYHQNVVMGLGFNWVYKVIPPDLHYRDACIKACADVYKSMERELFSLKNQIAHKLGTWVDDEILAKWDEAFGRAEKFASELERIGRYDSFKLVELAKKYGW